MISATTGWALAVPGDGKGPGHPVRTTDGGSHWEAMGPPSNLTSPNIEAVDFHDALQAWMLVVLGAESTASRELAVVASTADGGGHWSTTPKFAIDGHGVGMQFIDASHGWVFALPGAGGAIRTIGAIVGNIMATIIVSHMPMKIGAVMSFAMRLPTWPNPVTMPDMS